MTDAYEPTESVEVTLTCHTTDCENSGVPITLLVLDNATAAACGACGQPITDVLAPVESGLYRAAPTTEGNTDE